MTEKEFKFISLAIAGMTDYIQWTSSFGSGQITQMESPVPGLKLSPALSSLFGLAEDNAGLMLVMHEREASWLKTFPVAFVLTGFNDCIQVVSEAFVGFDTPVPQTAFAVFIPSLPLRTRLMANTLLGFGLIKEDTGQVQRINRIVELITPAGYAKKWIRKEQSSGTDSLFAAR